MLIQDTFISHMPDRAHSDSVVTITSVYYITADVITLVKEEWMWLMVAGACGPVNSISIVGPLTEDSSRGNSSTFGLSTLVMCLIVIEGALFVQLAAGRGGAP